MTEHGSVMPASSFFVGRHGRSWIVVGDFSDTYMTDQSHRYSDDLIGPYPTRETAQQAADRFNTEDGLST